MTEIKNKDGAVLRTVFADTLRWSNLRWANLSEADLSGANLRGAKQYICQIHASRHAIVAIDDDARIGCHRKPLAEWLETFEAVGRENGYSEAEIAEYGGWLRQIAAVLAARRGEVAGCPSPNSTSNLPSPTPPSRPRSSNSSTATWPTGRGLRRI